MQYHPYAINIIRDRLLQKGYDLDTITDIDIRDAFNKKKKVPAKIPFDQQSIYYPVSLPQPSLNEILSICDYSAQDIPSCYDSTLLNYHQPAIPVNRLSLLDYNNQDDSSAPPNDQANSTILEPLISFSIQLNVNPIIAIPFFDSFPLL